MFSIMILIRLIYVFELICGQGLFLIQVKRKKHFFLRLLVPIVIMVCWAIFIPHIQIDQRAFKVFYGCFMFLPIWLFSIFGLWFCFDADFSLLLLISIAGYTVQKIGSLVNSIVSVFNPLLLNFNGGGLNIWLFVNIFTSDILVFALCYFTIGKQLIKNQQVIMKNKTIYILSFVSAFTNLLFGMIYSYGVENNGGTLEVAINYLQNLLCCILVLVIMSGILQKGEVERELEHNKMVFAISKENYKNEKKTTEIINQKCHDLKHRVMDLMSGNTSDYSDVLDAINIYDSSIHTNNEALDVVYKQKQLFAQKNNIKISAMIDGEKLSFMRSTDIFILFGNLFDNAINAVSKIENENERIVYVKIFTKVNMLFISFENKIGENLIIENGEYKTTNKNKDDHGFGIRGIKEIVSKYDGIIVMNSENNIFKTDISFILK